MARERWILDGIVLRTHDVGDADRLCIVLTRQRGRIAARARAVRKLGSRMGALLLPGRRLTLDVRSEDGHATIDAARLMGEVPDLADPVALAAAQQGIELVLLLTEDDEPLPAVFDALFQFVHVCHVDPAHALVPFQLRLFHLLGFLPSHVDDRRYASLSAADKAVVARCTADGADIAELCGTVDPTPALRDFVAAVQEEHAGRTLRSADVYSDLTA